MPVTLSLRPENDNPARMAGVWLSTMENEWQVSDGADLIVIGQNHVRREIVEKILKSPDHDNGLMVFYGHTCPTNQYDDDDVNVKDDLGLCGHDESILDSKNCVLCSGWRVYAIACHSLRAFAPLLKGKLSSGTAIFGFECQVVLYPDESLNRAIGAIINSGVRILHSPVSPHVWDQRNVDVLRTVKIGFVRLTKQLARSEAVATSEKERKQMEFRGSIVGNLQYSFHGFW